jgi:sn-glycerol 3-phosphate transport system permease protein
VPRAGAPPIGLMLWNSLIMAMAITIGKLAISLHLGLRYRLFPFPVPHLLFLDHLSSP